MANLVLVGGKLFGTSVEYGNGNGVVFQLSPSGRGEWNYQSLHDFTGGADGQFPYSNVVFDNYGNMYGTTSEGGAYGYGVVWEITP